MSNIISVRVDEEEKKFLDVMASFHNLGVSNLIKEIVFEKLEDEYDLRCYDEAMKEFNKNPKTYSLKEVKARNGII